MKTGVALAAAVALVAAPVDARPFTRADLAPAFLRFERALAAADVQGAAFSSFDRRFDAFTMRAFVGDLAGAFLDLNAMAADLELGRPRTPTERVVDVLAVEATPAFLDRNADVAPTLRLRTVVPVDVESEDEVVVEGHVELVLAGGDVRRGPEVRLAVEEFDEVELDLPFPAAWSDLPRGDHELRFVAGERASLPRRLSVADAPLDALRARLLARLDAVAPETDHADAVDVARARARLLRRDPLGIETAIMVEPPAALADAVEAEVEALERGDDPYRGRTDDHWRTFRIGHVGRTDRSKTPARVFAPATDDDGARPLLVALHGAGADENMFFRAYGDGRLRRLARARGLVVVTPRTEAILRNDGTLENLIAAVRRDHAFDARRVYLLGHSMGAMAAMRRAAVDVDRLAAVVCIAGAAPLEPDGAVSPTLVVTGREDPIVPLGRVEPAARAAIEAGLPVELRVKDDRGHTLFVPRVLPETLDWLLTYSR